MMSAVSPVGCSLCSCQHPRRAVSPRSLSPACRCLRSWWRSSPAPAVDWLTVSPVDHHCQTRAGEVYRRRRVPVILLVLGYCSVIVRFFAVMSAVRPLGCRDVVASIRSSERNPDHCHRLAVRLRSSWRSSHFTRLLMTHRVAITTTARVAPVSSPSRRVPVILLVLGQLPMVRFFAVMSRQSSSGCETV